MKWVFKSIFIHGGKMVDNNFLIQKKQLDTGIKFIELIENNNLTTLKTLFNITSISELTPEKVAIFQAKFSEYDVDCTSDDEVLDAIDSSADFKWLLTNKGSANITGNLAALDAAAAEQFKIDVEILEAINSYNNYKTLLTSATTAITTVGALNSTIADGYINDDAIVNAINADTSAKYLLTNGGSDNITAVGNLNTAAAALYQNSIEILINHCTGMEATYCATTPPLSDSPYHICALSFEFGLQFDWIDSNSGTAAFDC
jgi:hypothetical protein